MFAAKHITRCPFRKSCVSRSCLVDLPRAEVALAGYGMYATDL